MERAISIFGTLIRMSTPLLITALGLVYSSRAGVVNIGIEGFMLTGALFGCIGSYLSGSALVGALTAIAASLAMAAVFAFFVLNLRADSTVVGAAINIFASGFTVTLNRTVFNTTLGVPSIKVFDNIPIPGLSKIPLLGTMFNQSIVCYIGYILIPVTAYLMDWTHIGLSIRAVGENS